MANVVRYPNLQRERDLGVKGHRIESYIMEKRNMLSAVTVESKKL